MKERNPGNCPADPSPSRLEVNSGCSQGGHWAGKSHLNFDRASRSQRARSGYQDFGVLVSGYFLIADTMEGPVKVGVSGGEGSQ